MNVLIFLRPEAAIRSRLSMTAALTAALPFVLPPAALAQVAQTDQPATQQTTTHKITTQKTPVRSHTVAPAENRPEEVIVTARRHAEKLKDVPLAVTALSARRLQQLDAESTNDVANYVPSLQFTDFASGYGTNARIQARPITFRGLNLARNFGINAASLVFLDGAPIIGTELPYGLDISQVEVIRGPQAVYFGRSTLSGAINYVTKTPADRWHGSYETKFGQYGTHGLEGSASGPLVRDKLSVGVSVSEQANDGYYNNAYDPHEKLGSQRTDSYAGTLNFTPTDFLSVKGYFNYFTNDDGPAATAQLSSYANNCSVGGTRPYYCGSFPSIGSLGFYQNTALSAAAKATLFHSSLFPTDFWNEAQGVQRQAIVSHVVTTLEIPHVGTLQDLWAYERDRSIGANDYTLEPYQTGSLYKYYVASLGYDTSDFDEELRLTSKQNQRLRWMIGGTYLRGDLATQSLADYIVTGQAEAQYRGAITSSISKSYGVFGGLYFDILHNLTLSAEARNQWDDRKDYTSVSSSLTASFESFSPRLSATYKITPDISAYVSYARGTRPGGFNNQLLPYLNNQAVLQTVQGQLGTSTLAYNEESLSTYEVGLKGEYFNKRLALNTDFYYGTLRNEQIANTVYVPSIANSLSITGNVGKTRIYGFEADGEFALTRIISLTGSFSWNATDVLRYPCLSCIAVIGTSNVDGHTLGQAPVLSGSLGADLHDRLGHTRWDWFAHGDYVYRGPFYLDVNNAGQLHSRNVVNLRGGVTSRGITIEGYVTNVTNDRHFTGGSQGSDFGSGSYTAFDFGVPPPRMFGGRVTYRF